jgi:hypothetical protein
VDRQIEFSFDNVHIKAYRTNMRDSDLWVLFGTKKGYVTFRLGSTEDLTKFLMACMEIKQDFQKMIADTPGAEEKDLQHIMSVYWAALEERRLRDLENIQLDKGDDQ